MIALGVVLGLLVAVCQSLSYLGTRHYVGPRGGGSRQLLVLAHVAMGVLSAAALPWVWPGAMPPVRSFAGPLVQASLFYLLGQMGLMVCLRYAEPSRVSPMLAFKLIVLAGLTIGLRHTMITPLQLLAIGMCLAGAVALNYAGGANHPAAVMGLVVTCVAYSLSDWNIERLVRAMGAGALMPGWQASVVSTLLAYVLCGLIAAVFLPGLGSRKAKDWIDASPFAVAWLAAMLFLFPCFATVGVVYGNILQSTRGLISVAMGSLLASVGLLHLEKAAARQVFARRFVAAALMLAAVVLYRAEGNRWLVGGALGAAGLCALLGIGSLMWQRSAAGRIEEPVGSA